MKRVLLVDDDAMVTRSYRDRLSAHGFQVNTAADGAAAIAILRSARPDLVVLDLLMPNVSGVQVLKFIREEPRLAKTPVVVLTNAYLNDLGRAAANLGIEAALLKAQCSPSVLMSVIDGILETKPSSSDASEISGPSNAVETPAETKPLDSSAQPANRSTSGGITAFETQPQIPPTSEPESDANAGEQLLAQSPAICADLRRLFQAFARAPVTGPDQKPRLQDFYRSIHVLTATAGQTEYKQVTQLATVLEALLYVLLDNPTRITPSVRHTLANLVDCMERLFQQARESRLAVPHAASVLVVDDDAVSNRLAVSALRDAQIEARSTEDPEVAWQWVQQEEFDLILLDIEMPGLDGFELCKRLRALPAYARTPVIYVTVHSDFQTRAKSMLSGGDDLIAKPILPLELAAKVVMHLLKGRIG
jgi:DNA-binding response OmpR family regulator